MGNIVSKLARVIGILALVLAVVAVIPSFAAFTPAILISLVALLMASYSIYFGWSGLGALTFVVVTAAVVGSPIFTFSSLKDNWALCLIVTIPYIIFLLACFIGLRRRRRFFQSRGGAF